MQRQSLRTAPAVRETLVHTVASRLAPWLCALLLPFATAAAQPAALELHGAGSTFVKPILSNWANLWSARSGVKIVYDGGGSGAGIAKAKAGQVDFGATDAPMSEEDLRTHGLVQFPIVAGGIVVIENVVGLGRRRLQINGPVLADIFMGKIKRWNDPVLQAMNPAVRLPDAEIHVVHRSDSSGTTYNFTAYLTKISSGWAGRLGTAKTLDWPVGVGTEGNANVANLVVATPNSIGYVEYGHAMTHGLRIATLRDTKGRITAPTQATIRAAVAAADWEHAPNFNLLLVGVQGGDAWPIAATVWIVMPAKAPSVPQTLDFFRWALRKGAPLADAQGFTPLPPSLVKLVEASWTRSFLDAGAQAARP